MVLKAEIGTGCRNWKAAEPILDSWIIEMLSVQAYRFHFSSCLRLSNLFARRERRQVIIRRIFMIARAIQTWE